MGKTKKVTIVGFGKLGQSLATVLSAKKDLQVFGWDVVQTNHPLQHKNLEELLPESLAVIVAVPSEHFANCSTLLKSVNKSTILVSCTKGIDPKTNKLPYEILKESFPQNPIAVVSGPMLSEELENNLPTVASIASDKEINVKEAVELFSETCLSLVYSNDPIGTSLLGILKNVYALSLGLSDGLGMGSNFKSCLSLIALTEISNILEVCGGNKNSILSPAGVSDFLTTGYSEKSRNYSYGFKFGKGENLEGIMAEGVKNIANVGARVGNTSDFKLFNGIKSIFLEKAPVKEALVHVVL